MGDKRGLTKALVGEMCGREPWRRPRKNKVVRSVGKRLVECGTYRVGSERGGAGMK